MLGAIINVAFCGSSLGLGGDRSHSFAAGFDGDTLAEISRGDVTLFNMGARFRARWLAGDYDPRGGKGES
jgi:hypothetical protein